MIRFRNVSFEITSIDVGVFEVTGRFLGRQIEKVELVFQVIQQAIIVWASTKKKGCGPH